jgi:hypothetical protein
MAQEREHSCRVLLHRLGLELLAGGLLTGFLTLAGAALIGVSPAIETEPSPNCTAFQVGSPFAAHTHIQLQNDGPERIYVRLDFVDHDGRDAQPIGYNPILNPSESSAFVFRTPALGAAVKLTSSGRNLQASTEIRFEDDTLPEIRKAIPCHVLDDAFALQAAG